MSALVSIASPPAASVAAMISAASGCFAPSTEKATTSGRRPLSRASVRILRPSARNRPSARRPFLSRSDRSRLTVALEKAVTWRGMASHLPFALSLSKGCFCSWSEKGRASTGSARTVSGRSSLFAEARLDQLDQSLERILGMRSGDMDGDRVAHRRAKHHEAHDRGAAHAVTILLDLDR